VVEYGMSDLGPMNFAPQYDQTYARAWGEPQKISSQLQEKVDDEIRKYIDEAQKKATLLLKKHRKELDAVTKKLLEIETMDSDEFERVMGMPKARKELKRS